MISVTVWWQGEMERQTGSEGFTFMKSLCREDKSKFRFHNATALERHNPQHYNSLCPEGDSPWLEWIYNFYLLPTIIKFTLLKLHKEVGILFKLTEPVTWQLKHSLLPAKEQPQRFFLLSRMPSTPQPAPVLLLPDWWPHWLFPTPSIHHISVFIHIRPASQPAVLLPGWQKY